MKSATLILKAITITAVPLSTSPFERAVKVFESCGNRYVRNGYTVIDADMEDHVCIRTENGRPTLVAIEVSYRDKGGYAPVEHPVSDDILGRYFVYDAESLTYRRSDKVIPTAFTCRDIREHLYTHGFDIDGIHYVRYKRSAERAVTVVVFSLPSRCMRI